MDARETLLKSLVDIRESIVFIKGSEKEATRGELLTILLELSIDAEKILQSKR